MNLSRINFVQALGCLIAILFYLIGPVVGISLLPVGVRGTMAMRIDFVFVIPVILIGLALLVSILPIGKISSAGGFIAGIVTMVIGLCGGGTLVAFARKMGSLASIDIPELSALNIGIDALSMFLSIGWGALTASIVLIVSAIVGIFVMSVMEANNGGSSYGSKPYNRTGGGSGSYRTTPQGRTGGSSGSVRRSSPGSRR